MSLRGKGLGDSGLDRIFVEKWVGQRRFWRVAFVSGEPLTNAFAIRGNDPISGDQAARYGALDCGGSVKCG